MLRIIFIVSLLSLFNSLDEIEYKITHNYIGKIVDKFSVKFNRIKGIKAEYEEISKNQPNSFI
jgi:hypothetical protein